MSIQNQSDLSTWSYLTNHFYVLLCLFRDPHMRLREVAVVVGITERAVQRIVSELETDGVLTRVKTGRRNSYSIDRSASSRSPVIAERTVGEMLEFLGN